MPIARARRDDVEILTLNRPESRNAIDADLAQSLSAALDELADDDCCRSVILTGEGSTFCAGVDLKMQAAEGIEDRVIFPGTGFAGLTQRHFPKPLICALNGSAYGGGLELVLACDLVVAAADAKLAFTEASLGLIPDAGGLIRLPNRIPIAIAMEMFFTADPITAERAFELGLVNRVVPPGDVVEESLHIAERISRCSPLSIEMCKKLAYAALNLHETESWPVNDDFMEAMSKSHDFEEGPVAWVERRSPRYLGR